MSSSQLVKCLGFIFLLECTAKMLSRSFKQILNQSYSTTYNTLKPLQINVNIFLFKHLFDFILSALLNFCEISIEIIRVTTSV